jgi:CheY-like chemotaxis protein
MGLSEVLMATEPTEEQQGYLKTICRSVDALLAIIGNVLDYSKIEAGKVDLIPDRFSFNELMEEMQAMFEVQATAKGLELKLEMVDPGPFQMVADRNHFRQVLINLIGNAIKFTESGSITLMADRERIEDDFLPANKTFYHVVVAVADTGIGIPEDKKSELFVPFNQLVDSRTRKYEGTGLGLAISKRIIETGMKGEIVVRDNEPQGTVFEVHVPVEGFITKKRAEDAKKLTHSGLLKHSLSQAFYAHKILVADDNRLNCQVMQAMLEKMGHNADFVTNGRDSIEYLSQNEGVDVVLMDIMMPLMDGLEATRRIRDGEAGQLYKDIPIVALTAFALTADKEEILSQGVDHYLPKPIKPNDLRHVLTELARKIQSQA